LPFFHDIQRLAILPVLHGVIGQRLGLFCRFTRLNVVVLVLILLLLLFLQLLQLLLNVSEGVFSVEVGGVELQGVTVILHGLFPRLLLLLLIFLRQTHFVIGIAEVVINMLLSIGV